MKIIDLLNKIANGEEVPKIIKYKNARWYFNKKYKIYYMNNTEIELFYIEKITERLNDEVEIIEEKEMCHKCHKYPAEYNQTYCEFCLGISKLEEHKIPEKLNVILHSDNIVEIPSNEMLMNKINEILDYLEKQNE